MRGILKDNRRLPACNLTLSTTQNLANATSTVILFDVVTYLIGNLSYAAGKVYIKETGIYSVNCQLWYVASAGGTFRFASIRKNGGTMMGETRGGPNGASEYATPAVSRDLYLVAGEYLEALGNQNSGGALDVYYTPPYCSFSVRRVG